MLLVIALVVMLVLALAMALLFRPKAPPTREPNALEVPTIEEGKTIPVVFGTKPINSPFISWYGNVRIIKVKVGGGKK